jgi:hypothetical protein
MIPLTIDIAILDELTRLTCFETNALSCNAAAIGTADVNLVHPQTQSDVVPAEVY